MNWRIVRTIRGRVTSLAAVGVLGLAGFAALSLHTIGVTKVGGAHYDAIVSSKDLIADVLPPPAYLLESYLNAFEVVSATTPAERDKLLEHGAQLRKDYDDRHAFWKTTLADSAMREALLRASYEPAEKFYELRDGAFTAAIRSGRFDDANSLLHGPMRAAYESHLTAILKVVDLANTQYTAVESTARAVVRRQSGLMLVVACVAGIVLSLMGWLVVRAIRTPLDRAVDSLARVADGDLSVRMAYQADDELGQMGASLDRAVESMGFTIGEMSASAQTLARASEELTAVSQQLGASAEETAAQSGVVSAAAEQVSKNVQIVATGSEELNASIREIAKSTSEATRVASTAVRVAEATNLTISKLGTSSAEIGNVLKVITSIAEQTNLLALNATIEAARAGEAGKGFAVVANEVKELAKETARATDEIGRKIAAIQLDTAGAVSAIGEIGDVISQIHGIQTTIAGAVEEQTATTAEIGRNVAEAARGASEIAENITGVAQAAQSTASGATQTQASAAELSRMAAELQGLVGRFQLDGARSDSTRAPSRAVSQESGGRTAQPRRRRERAVAVGSS